MDKVKIYWEQKVLALGTIEFERPENKTGG